MKFNLLTISALVVAYLSVSCHACMDNGDCRSDQYCQLQPNCKAPGACVIRPLVCSMYCLTPEIEGCDSNTYCNECIANAHGTSVHITTAASSSSSTSSSNESSNDLMAVNPPPAAVGSWIQLNVTDLPDDVLSVADMYVASNDDIVDAWGQIVAGKNYKLLTNAEVELIIYCPLNTGGTCVLTSIVNGTQPSIGSWNKINTTEVPDKVLQVATPYVSNAELLYAYNQVLEGSNYKLFYYGEVSVVIYCPVGDSNTSCILTSYESGHSEIGSWTLVNVTEIPENVINTANPFAHNELLESAFTQLVAGLNYKLIYPDNLVIIVYCPPSSGTKSVCEVTSYEGGYITPTTPPHRALLNDEDTKRNTVTKTLRGGKAH